MNQHKEERFWHWFVQHQAELFDFEADRERIFDSLAAELRRVHPDLTFEFGPEQEKREFVVSAGGIKPAFPSVVSLAQAAPKLDRWHITAFRPRRSPLNSVLLNGKRADPEDLSFTLLENGETAGIHLFIPGFRDDDVDWKQIGYLMLDDALGEFDVESRLGLIKMSSPESPSEGDRFPFPELPCLFDQLVARLEGRTEQPS